MNYPWFKRIGIIFIPKSVMAWILFAIGIGYAVYLFIDIDSRSHSVSDTLLNFVFNLFILGVVYNLLAYLISKTPK